MKLSAPCTRILAATASLLILGSGAPLSGAVTEKPAIEIAGAETLKGIQKVAVASFTVQYVLEQTWDKEPQPLKKACGVNVAHLLDSAKMQSTADTLYREFVDDLRKSGMDVVAPETLVQSSAYRNLAAKSSPTPRLEEAQGNHRTGSITSLFYTAQGSTMLLDPKVDYLAAGFVPEITDPTLTQEGRTGLYTQNMTEYDASVQQELGAATLHVRIYVPIANVDLKEGKSAGCIKPGLRLGERFTRVSVGHRGEYARMYLKEPLLLSGTSGNLTTMCDERRGVRSASINPERYWQAMNEGGSVTLNAFADRLRGSI